MIKPIIRITPNPSDSPLLALSFLSSVDTMVSYHEKRDSRHPLGIYNLSVGRICNKMDGCVRRLNAYYNDRDDRENNEEIIDYLELSLYAAAEHVDDIERIAYTFFPTDRLAQSSKDIRKLKSAMKPIRDEISTFANTVKHSHGRVRLWDVKLNHDGKSISLLGFFVEGFRNGAAAPNPILHSSGKVVISMTSFLWNILTYIVEMSIALANFLECIGIAESQTTIVDIKNFKRTALKLAGLPLYSFDDNHPFARVTWNLGVDESTREDANSNIYGSLLTPWTKSLNGNFSGERTVYAGDGATRSFALVQPKALQIQHWT